MTGVRGLEQNLNEPVLEPKPLKYEEPEPKPLS